MYHDSVSVIFPRFTSFVEDLVLCCCQVILFFSSQNRSLLVFAEVSMNTVLPFFVSLLLKHHLPNPSSSFQRNVRPHAPSSPLDKLWRAVTKQECLALGLPCSSRMLVHGSRGLLVMICHHRFTACMPSSRYWIWECSQFSGIIRLIHWSRRRRQIAAGIWWQSWYNEKY